MQIRPSLAALALSLLAACGGGNVSYSSAGNGSGGGTSLKVEGTWAGSTQVVGSSVANPIAGAVVQGGLAFFYDSGGDLFLLPPLGDKASVKGHVLIFSGPPVLFPDGKSFESVPVTLTVSSQLISGSFVTGATTTDFQLAPAAPFKGNASVVAGTWHGFYLVNGMSPPSVALTVQPSGVFAGNDADGCHLTGTIKPLDLSADLFSVTLTSTGGAACQGQLTGLAFESSTDDNGLFGGTTGIFYYFTVSNTAGAFVAELKVQ